MYAFFAQHFLGTQAFVGTLLNLNNFIPSPSSMGPCHEQYNHRLLCTCSSSTMQMRIPHYTSNTLTALMILPKSSTNRPFLFFDKNSCTNLVRHTYVAGLIVIDIFLSSTSIVRFQDRGDVISSFLYQIHTLCAAIVHAKTTLNFM